jgi:hypothetical protein
MADEANLCVWVWVVVCVCVCVCVSKMDIQQRCD